MSGRLPALEAVWERPEVQLLVQSMKPAWTAHDRASFAKALSHPARTWSQLLKAAAIHRLHHVLLNHLRRPAFRSLVLDKEFASLKELVALTVYQNLELTQAALQVLRDFEQANIPVLLVKGPALAVRHYGALGERPFHDVDLLVRKADVEAVEARLKAKGFYSSDDVPFSVLLRNERSKDRLYQRAHSLVEVHWSLTQPMLYGIDMSLEALWAKRSSVVIGKREVSTVGLDDEVFYLALHGSAHRWMRLRWLMDLIMLLQQKDRIDWVHLIDKAAKQQVSQAFLLGWYLAHQIGVALPEALEYEIQRTKQLPALAEQCMQSWFSYQEPDLSEIESVRFLSQLVEGRLAKLRFVWDFMTTPFLTDWQALPQISPRASLVFAVYRPIRLAGRYLRS